jgi:hypothetical protein
MGLVNGVGVVVTELVDDLLNDSMVSSEGRVPNDFLEPMRFQTGQ